MKYGKIWPHVVFVILVGVFVFTQPPPKNNQIISAKETAGVLKVVDGDTIEVSLSGRTERVRLIGIDSPEVLDDRKPIQCFGEEASNKAKEILIAWLKESFSGEEKYKRRIEKISEIENNN